MALKEFSAKVQTSPSYLLSRKLDAFIRTNRSFRNLDQDNRKVLLDILEEYRVRSRRGYDITTNQVRRDMYKLHSQRIKLGLSKVDLEDIRKILTSFIE